jgi:hypothetical protein
VLVVISADCIAILLDTASTRKQENARMRGSSASPNSVIELLSSLVTCYTAKLLSYYKPIRGGTL